MLRAGIPHTWWSHNLTGGFAFEVTFQPAAGECTIEMQANVRAHQDGGAIYLRVEELDRSLRTFGGGSGIDAAAHEGVVGVDTHALRPKTDTSAGFQPRTINVESGARVQYFVNDLYAHDGPNGYGGAFWVRAICTTNTPYTLRAAREAFIASSADFASLTSVDAILPQATLYGSITRHFSAPVEWSYLMTFTSPGFDLGIRNATTEQHWTEPGAAATRPILGAEDYEFSLTIVAPLPFFLAAAAFQNVEDMTDAESLPSWV
ncbi:MAG: hypothetical protein LC623_04660 [Halobacteriales archaeon]|nr:hypothetical protein [Halobacteriales archaeon]